MPTRSEILIKAAQLRHRMAIQAITPHRLPKRPTEVQQRMADLAVDMLVLIQMMPYIMCDIREELEKAGKYHHEIKRRYRQAEDIIFSATDPAYHIFARYNPETAKGFIERMESFYHRLKEAFNPQSLDGTVAMLDGICSLVERYNRQLEPTYYFDHADPLYKIPRLLDCIPAKRHDITGIIEFNIRTFNNERHETTNRTREGIRRNTALPSAPATPQAEAT